MNFQTEMLYKNDNLIEFYEILYTKLKKWKNSNWRENYMKKMTIDKSSSLEETQMRHTKLY